MSMAYERVIQEQLIATATVASERALLGTIETISRAAGVASLDGMPVQEFFQRRKAKETEELIADFADVNPTAATHVKALWDRYSVQEGGE